MGHTPYMTLRAARTLFALAVIAAITAGAIRFIPRQTDTRITQEPNLATSREPSAMPDFVLTAVQVGEDTRRILTCQGGNCQVIPPVNTELTDAVTDGTSWYHYRELDNNIALVKTDIATGDTAILIEQTRLAAPRGLHISPDNNNIFYWLDNIGQPTKKLTELWFYSTAAKGTQLIAEKVTRPDVITNLRWNRSSNLAWFIGDTSKPSEKTKTELLIATLEPPGIAAAFTSIDWLELADTADHGVMDISSDQSAIAYIKPKLFNRSELIILDQAGQSISNTIPGDVIYLHWLADNELFYVIQNNSHFSFWQTSGQLHRQIAKRPGRIESLRGDNQGTFFVYAARDMNRTRAFALDTKQRIIRDQGPLPVFSDHTYLVHFDPIEKSLGQRVASITSPLPDDELVAFLEKNLSSITDSSSAKLLRIIITASPNTVLLEYRQATGQSERVLVTVNDATHTEWSIKARYRDKSGEWIKDHGSSSTDPPPLRLYEWEADINQWILKEEYDE